MDRYGDVVAKCRLNKAAATIPMQLTPHSLLFALWLVAVAVLARQGASGARQSANAVVGCFIISTASQCIRPCMATQLAES